MIIFTIALGDTKPYDREFFGQTPGHDRVAWRFHEFRLNSTTAATAKGAQAACVFVNDCVDRACLEILAREKVQLVALRCAGFKNVYAPCPPRPSPPREREYCAALGPDEGLAPKASFPPEIALNSERLVDLRMTPCVRRLSLSPGERAG